MPQSLDACFFVDEIPDIIYEDGLFHIVQTVGNYRFERVMRPAIFFATIAKAVEVSRQHRLRSNVVSIVPRHDDHAASDVGSAAK